jgi:hypothetical protein
VARWSSAFALPRLGRDLGFVSRVGLYFCNYVTTGGDVLKKRILNICYMRVFPSPTLIQSCFSDTLSYINSSFSQLYSFPHSSLLQYIPCYCPAEDDCVFCFCNYVKLLQRTRTCFLHFYTTIFLHNWLLGYILIKHY